MSSAKQDIRTTFGTLFSSKYVLTVIGFLVWMTVIDTDSLLVRRSYGKKISELTEEKARLQNEIEQDKRKMHELQNNRASLEKFAREEYYMKRDDEVIFIIKE